MRHNPVNNTERVFYFIFGVLMSALVSSLVSYGVSLSIGLLVMTTATMALVAVVFISIVYNRLLVVSDSMGRSVKYVHESFVEKGEMYFRGEIYEKLNELVKNAESEILVVTAMYDDVISDDLTDNHPTRSTYLNMLERRIEQGAEHGFEYTRILQVPRGLIGSPITVDSVGRYTYDHCYRIVSKFSQKDFITVMTTPEQILVPYMVIDRRYLIIEIDALNEDGDKYAAGFLFIDDKEGSLVKPFVNYFRAYNKRALPVRKSDLEKND